MILRLTHLVTRLGCWDPVVRAANYICILNFRPQHKFSFTTFWNELSLFISFICILHVPLSFSPCLNLPAFSSPSSSLVFMYLSTSFLKNVRSFFQILLHCSQMSQEEHLAWSYGNITKISLYFPSCITFRYRQMKTQFGSKKKINVELSAVSILFLSLYYCTLRIMNPAFKPWNKTYLFQKFTYLLHGADSFLRS